MFIERVIVQNYRMLKSVDIELGSGTNIIVGNNETGKSTLLEAIHLCLSFQLGRRIATYDLHPFLFNQATVTEYLANLQAGKPTKPPEINIELYFKNDPALALLRGQINSLRLDVPGLRVVGRLDETYADQFGQYISDPKGVKSLPVEYYELVWQSFANEEPMKPRNVAIKSALIDPSSISNAAGPSRYVAEMIREHFI